MDETTIAKLSNGTENEHEGKELIIVNHNFSEITRSRKALHEVYDDYAYVAIGCDIVELNMGPEPPQFNRIHVRGTIISFEVQTAGYKIGVKYENENHIYETIYTKGRHGKWNSSLARTKLLNGTPSHIQPRSGITCAEFVTVTPEKHYFCYLEAMEPGIQCIDVEGSILNTGSPENHIILPNTDSLVYPSPVKCSLCSNDGILKTQVGEGNNIITTSFNMFVL